MTDFLHPNGDFLQLAPIMLTPASQHCQPVVSTSKAQNEDVTVFVSGSTFCIVPSLFQKVRNLPWYDLGGLPHLDEDPDHFEIILQFYLYGNLPSKTIIKKHKDELLRLVAPLQEANELHSHIFLDGKTKKKKKSANPSDFMKAKNSIFVSGGGLSVRSANMNATSIASSKKSMGSFLSLAKKSKADIPKVVQSVTFDSADSITGSVNGSILSSTSSKENPKKKPKMLQGITRGIISSPTERKKTHAEWCASEFIV